MLELLLSVTIVIVTVLVYLGMTRIYRHFPIPFLLPVLTTTIVMIICIKLSNLSFDAYMLGGRWLNELLGPAVVAFAYPLYQQRKMIVKYAIPILTGVFIGLLTGMVTIFLFAKWLVLPKEMILSLIPKSITTPVAMQMSSVIGGTPSLTVAFVMIAGISGAILGPIVLKWFRIDSLLGTGIGLGSASHAIGTSKAYEYGEFTVSMSSVSMTISAIVGPIVGFFISLLL